MQDEFRVGQNVMDVNGAGLQHGSADHRRAIDLHAKRQQVGEVFGLEAPGRDGLEDIAPQAGDHRLVRPAKSSGELDQRIEHRLEIERRAADHLEHLGGGGLLLQRVGEVVGALVQCAEQPRILDRDHRLRGEAGDQRDLPLGERAHLLAENADCADQLAVPDHRHRQQRADPEFRGGRAHLPVFVADVHGREVDDVNDPQAARDASDRGSFAGAQRPLQFRGDLLRQVNRRRNPIGLAVVSIEHAELGRADASRVLQNGVKDRLERARRAGKEAQHLGGRRLLLQRLGELALARGEPPLQLRHGDRLAGGARSRLRSGRTRHANVRSALR